MKNFDRPLRPDDRLRSEERTIVPEDKTVRPEDAGAEPIPFDARRAKVEVPEAIIPKRQCEELRARWDQIQTAFIDEPRKAVQDADTLVASAVKQISEAFADQRSQLEKQWTQGDQISTEELRLALQRYRSFFSRLLSI